MAKSERVPEKGLTKLQLDAVALILEGNSLAEAARKLRVGTSTLYRWAHTDAFKEQLDAGRRVIFDEAIGRIKAASGKAVDKLVSVMRGPDLAEARKAATTILELGFRSKEMLEFEARIAALERMPPGSGMIYEISEQFFPVMDSASRGLPEDEAGSVEKPGAPRASKSKSGGHE